MPKSKTKQWFRPGNPARLSWRGHVFPAASIARFAGRDGTVQLWRKGYKPVQVDPNNEIFCALRGWDHGTEHGLMNHIETEFRRIAEAIIAGKTELSVLEIEAVTRFWYLWEERFELKHTPHPEMRFPAISPDAQPLTREQRENLESNRYTYMVDGAVPGPQAAGIRLMMKLGPWLSQQAPLGWNIIRSEKADFLVPDSFGGSRFVPISPECCLTTEVPPNSGLSRDEVRHINAFACDRSKEYVFARDLRRCL